MGIFTDRDDELPLTTLPGLTAFLERDTSAPKKLTMDRYRALSPTERERYNDERSDYISRNVIVLTPQVKDCVEKVETMINNNRRLPGEKRPGIILTGLGAAGKTTTTEVVMTNIYNQYKDDFPNMKRDGRVPVVYVEVPFGSTAKRLMTVFARFFGLTVATRDTHDTLMVRVCAAMREARTQLIVVDELQNLSTKNQGNGESVQALRQLHSQVAGIFILSGVGLRESELFDGATGRQLSGRLTFLDLQSFTLANPRAAAEWRALVRAFEREMPLLAHQVGSLAQHSKTIHDFTAGSISTLAKIFQSSAKALIRNGDPALEFITLDLLLAQPRDKAAMEAGEHDAA